MILQPQQDFPIVRQIANHLDVATYYVQAVVRDADGTIVDTVRLTDQGGQRFQKRYRTPVDRSGQGAYISIVTSVYTDAGYTTKSNNYGDEENTYLIADRLTHRSGGGVNFDLSDIRRVVQDEIKKAEKEEKEIKIPDYTKSMEVAQKRIDEGFQAIKDNLSAGLKPLYQIPTEKTDLTPVLLGIQNLAVAIDEKDVTPETDLGPAINEVKNVVKTLEAGLKAVTSIQRDNHELLVKSVGGEIQKGMKAAKFTNEISVQPHQQMESQTPKETKRPFNIRKLVS